MKRDCESGFCNWLVCLAVGACSIGIFVAMLTLATAHTVGGPCASTVENCEDWSATVQGPPVQPGQRPDEFPSAIARNGTTVFAGAKAVSFDVADPYSSTASWAITAYDIKTGAERWHVFRNSRA